MRGDNVERVRAESHDHVQAVQRALRVMEAIAFAPGPVRLIDLAQRVDLHKATTFRLLATLESMGYVEQKADTGRYALGPRALIFGGLALEKAELRAVARPFLEQLMKQTGETANLVIPYETEVLFIDKVEGPSSLRMSVALGKLSPAHSTGAGKVLLAHRPEMLRPLLSRGLERLTPNTITSHKELQAQLRQVIEQGYAIDDEEGELGLRCVAAPVRDHSGQVVAAISVSGSTAHLGREQLQQLKQVVVEAARGVSSRLGHRD